MLVLNFHNLQNHLKEYFLFHQKYKPKVVLLLYFEKKLEEFRLDNICIPSGASKNKEDQAIFSNDGPYLISPALTNKPRVIPKMYKLKNNKEER